MTINELRGVEHPINWYPPMAQSTYMGMTKRDLVDHLAVAYYNWLEAERANVRVTSYAKKKCDQADKAMYSILPALDISLDAAASAHNTEYGDDPEFDRLYRIIGEVKRRYACETPYNDQLEEARSEIVRLGKLVEEFADKVEIQAKKARKATRELRKAKKQLDKAEAALKPVMDVGWKFWSGSYCSGTVPTKDTVMAVQESQKIYTGGLVNDEQGDN